jgi:hypothetical protein
VSDRVPRAASARTRAPRAYRGAARLPAQFNADVLCPRLLFLLSPTCEICLRGADLMAEAVVSASDAGFKAYVVWLPVLSADTPRVARRALGRFPTDPRVFHFWDAELALSTAYHQVLELDRRKHRVAWDLYLLYAPGVVWREAPPPPSFWMHQLFVEDVPELDAEILRRELEAML